MSAKRKNTHSNGKQTSPTGVALFAAFFKEQIEQSKTYTIHGRRRKVCLLEITATQFLQQALKGDERAIKNLLVLVKKAEKWRGLQPKRQVLVLTPVDAHL